MTITRLDVLGVLTVLYLSAFGLLILLIVRDKIPSIETFAQIASLFNTKGGIIMLLSSLWIGTLAATMGFAVWVILRGVDPQHAVVITLFGVLTGTAFGTVNGALFKTMTGEEPSKPGNGNGNGKPPGPQPAPTEAPH